MNKRLFLLIAYTCLFTAIPLCSADDNQLTDQEQSEGWQLLFNGKDYDGWKCNNGKEVASEVFDGSMQPYKSGGYLILHEKTFGNFVLKCDVKMPESCNSGIFLRVEDPANPVHTGFEIQVASGTGTSCHDFGAIYDLVPTTKNVSKGPGTWNRVEIKCLGPNISVTVNDELVCQMNADEFDLPGERAIDGDHKYKLDGKSRVIKDFARTGLLGFQDHGHPVWYKNVKVLPLP
ncbi:3-keto-disaccharide hydrolase [Novipirellula artificiosorum]|uniref:3-keto-alpha-glucoside-1,2-lyase/3-keto-2-hydroxy-glucal hydratase domain-containing protein n=1 Tax=Novipirellula artificiosorum TaxID=2528016 RepID=A0A5C6D7L2_9BACT|nr:DUF1080 domain-containing protein [Novipirellula artificiosorum]TWU30869.1 hypothetical protein Poly41_65630 [Novipirellula artificiosorum]